MMASSPFDTLKVVERLEGAGVPAAQARAHVAVLSDVLTQTLTAESENMAELYLPRQESSAEFSLVRIALEKLDAKVEKLDAKVDARLAELRSELIRWVVTVAVSLGILQTALISGLLLKLLH
ncbi:DUF1640 domain-containing protein [Pseudoduganella sp. FT93W]|uniref:DUF1640 domain-containing protein n=1 Tax=Duganella fentianensis TaxID=2692177 RepID=A0A845HZ24_9BURK|nr:DUF1640 domain-containing protein [Duganella fentianensis]MYN46614.1 DUF1640 domain-containing protein [Duganella fentianensis]